MTAATMLIGAWLLIHHQCCASNQNEKSRSSLLIDQLSRRSNLEKNFMRFGRSPSVWIDEDEPGLSTRGGRGADFMRFGRASSTRVGEAKRGIPIRAGRDVDFIRFGRSLPLIENGGNEGNFMSTNHDFVQFDKPTFDIGGNDKLDIQYALAPLNLENHDNQSTKLSSTGKIPMVQERSGKNSNFMRFGRLPSTAWDNLSNGVDMDFVRFGWSPGEKRRGQDFMRFGRIANTELMEDKRRGSDFMRFGRILGAKMMEDKRRGSDFMRFGRTLGEDLREDKRRGSDFMRFGRTSGADVIEDKRRGSDFMRFGRTLGADMMGDKRRGSDFMRFGRTSGLETMEDKRRGSDFMRFGRSLLSLDGEDKSDISDQIPPQSIKGNSVKVQAGMKKGEEGTARYEHVSDKVKESDISVKPVSSSFALNEQQPDFFAIQERARNDFMRFGRFPALQLDPKHEIETRAGRAMDFMRFGRSQEIMENEKKRTRQDFMRFGRAQSVGEGKGIHARAGNNAGFIRFGRGFGEDQKRGLEGRSNSGFIRFGKAGRLGPIDRNEDGRPQPAEPEDMTRFGPALPSPFQPGFILGPELSFLPALSLHHPYRSARSDFMRFPG